MKKDKVSLLQVVMTKVGGIYAVVKYLQKILGDHFEFKIVVYQEFRGVLWFIKYIFYRGKYSDIIHLHGAWTFHLLPFVKKPKKPLLISPHGAFRPHSLKKSKWKKKVALKLFLRRVYNNADCFHALTYLEAKDILDMAFQKKPIAIIPNGIDVDEKLKISKKTKEKLLKLAQNRRIFVSLSRLDISKGLNMLIEAFSLLDQKESAVLFIGGSGSKRYTEQLRNMIKERGLTDSIFMLGELNGEDKYALYDICDVFVLPSLTEGFGLTVLEAYRQKVPVITTTATPFEDINKKEIGWYVSPEPQEILLAMNTANSVEKEVLLQMGLKGFRWLEDNFSNLQIEQKYLELYRWLAGSEKEPKWLLKA